MSVPDSTDAAAEAALAARGGNVVLNLAAVRKLGFPDAQAAIGKTAQVDLFMGADKPRVPVTIVGVVSDARFRSARERLDDVMFRLGSDYVSTLVVRYDARRPDAVVQELERVWKAQAPDYLMKARFSEDIVDDLYRNEDRRAALLGAFALLAVVIGCLGLFGLAAFTAERRTREIGIRKVLGARTRDIVRLLVWQFTRPVLVANLIAWPVAWWAMRDWLNGFDSRIGLGPTPFVAASLLAFAIAMATVAGHAIRVARTNPVHALRYE
jgi:putative ABC transport system permease protein